MKKITYLMSMILFITVSSTFAQLTPGTGDVWTPLGDTLLQHKTHDPDSGDGANDGAVYIDGQDTNPLGGASLVVGGTIEGGTPINVEIVCYNTDNSWVTARVEFWNKTDNEAILLPNGVDENDPKWENKAVTWDFGNASEANPGELPARTFILTTIAADDGDEFEIRFYRQWSYHLARNFSVDYVKVNGNYVSISGSSLSVNDENFANKVSVYPNPANDLIRISGKEAKEYSIYNVLGSQVRATQPIKNESINVSNIQEGIYFLNLFNEHGNRVTKKIVIQN